MIDEYTSFSVQLYMHTATSSMTIGMATATSTTPLLLALAAAMMMGHTATAEEMGEMGYTCFLTRVF